MVAVHGWRLYKLFLPLEGTDEPVLITGTGLTLNSRTPPIAHCKGFTSFIDWLDDDVKAMSKEERHPPESPSPQINCTCGYFGHRLWPDESEWYAVPTIYAHVTCIGRTILHTEGWRTAAYKVDYIIPPSTAQVPLGESYLTHIYGPPERKPVDLVPLVERICKKLQIPLIPFYGDGACAECVDANKEAGREPSWEEGKHGYEIGAPVLGVDDLPDTLEPLC